MFYDFGMLELTAMITTLYRFYDRTDRLLYVGVSSNPGRRFSQHNKSQSWWRSVVRTTHETFEIRSDALLAEQRTIREEGPLFNKTYVNAGARQCASVKNWMKSAGPVIAQNRLLQGMDLRVLLWLCGMLDPHEWVAVNHGAVAKEMSVEGFVLHRPQVTRSMKALVDHGILLKGENRTYRLNPGVGWKGDGLSQEQAQQDVLAGKLSLVR